MRMLLQSLPYIQIVLSALLITVVLLQQSDADVGGAFGGADGMNAAAHTRRGFERVIFNLTILIGILFAISAFIALVIH
jgi:protein translocase SecG subunit